MIKLRDILNESSIKIRKNEWVPIKNSELGDLKKQIFDLIQNAYASIGGHVNIKTPADLSDEGDIFNVIDIDDDADVDAVVFQKNKKPGSKFVGMGQDGSKPAKIAAITYQADKLKEPGHYIEVSGAMKDVLVRSGLTPITDEKIVLKALEGKKISDFNKETGEYTRELAGHNHTKIMFGKPRV